MPPGSRVYYKFKSTAKFKTIDLVDHWVSVAELKPLIAQKEVCLGRSCLLHMYPLHVYHLVFNLPLVLQ